MKTFKIVLLFLAIISCERKNEILEIDAEIDSKVESLFILEGKSVWIEFESSFLNYLRENGNLNSEEETLESIMEFICTVVSHGGIINKVKLTDSSLSVELLNHLRKIEFLKNEEFNYNFIFKNYNPIIKKHSNLYNNDTQEMNDLLIGMGLKDPKNNDFNLAIISMSICEKITIEDLKRPGLYKSLILLYFGNVLIPDKD